ncbi:carboxypeptidase-like regulatory domain-containing protein [Algoriphagus namhaensis]
MKRLILFFVSVVVFSLAAAAQTAQIQGVVKDAETGETLPFCNVFINNTTISTATDMEGKYLLEGLEPGPVEVSFSYLGYVAETKKVTLNPGGSLTVNLSMQPYVSELSDVEIKASRDKSWERDLRKFTNLFLGNDEVAAMSSIENPWVVDFGKAEEKNTFIATAIQPLEIINNYLGYKITFDLKEFYDNPTSYRIAGAARFEEMDPVSEAQRTNWNQNRAETYRKSPMNMFRAMIKGEQEQEGFLLYGDKPGGSASMNMRSDIFANELGTSVIPYKSDQLVKAADVPGQYLIHLKGRIEIHYQKGYSQVNTYVDAPYPVSWLEVAGDYVRVNENGAILNPQDLVFSGDMDRKRISTLLPLDYDADKAIQLQNLEKTAANYQEKIYLHTDKPYYYAGDEVFFKGYLNYGNPYLRSELSKVLHVELVDADRNAVLQKKFTIQDGLVYGNFYIPDSLAAEQYYLRSFTNWARNYGPDHYYTAPLRILTPYQRVDEVERLSEDQSYRISLVPEQRTYGPRQQVILSLQTVDKTGRPVASTLSVSVLDQTQIVPVRESAPIQPALALADIPTSVGIDRFSYPVEINLKEDWIIYDQKNKPTAGSVTAFVNDFEGMVSLEADREGVVSMDGMEFYGKMKLAIQATDRKDKPVSKIEKVEPLRPPMAFPSDPYFPKIKTVSDPIRPPVAVEEYQELDQVTVEETSSTQTQALYGKPTYVVTGEKLLANGNTSDLVSSLAGNVPGMRVTLAGGSGQQQIRIRGGATSVGGSMEPVVMLNGSVMVSSPNSTAADNIKSINPFDIERVEIVARTVSMLGDEGRNGVIAIYLKTYQGGVSAASKLNQSTGFAKFEIEGFQPPKSFYQVDYSQEPDPTITDRRQTLYWNPFLVTDEKGKVQISFYTNEIAGPMTVEVRGLGLDGLPISGTFTINRK